MIKWLALITILTLTAAVATTVYYESQNPCVRYGPDKVQYYQQIGNMIVPVTYGDCLERVKKSEVEK